MDALVGMGTSVIKHLQDVAAKHKSVAAQRAAMSVLQFLQKKMNAHEKMAPTMSNVLTQLRWIQVKPEAPEAQAAVQNLKSMGSAALPHLVRIAEHPDMGLKEVAVQAMTLLTGRSLGHDLAKWKALAEELQASGKPKAAPAAAAPAEAKKEVLKKESGKVEEE